ncbi:WD repeat-containing protein 97 isoform X4 [Lampetra planeri]
MPQPVMNLLDYRDTDIALITKGQLEGKQSQLDMEHVQEEGFWQYMNLLYWKPTELFDGDSGVLDFNSAKKNIPHVFNSGGSFTILEKSTKCKESETFIDRYGSPSVRNDTNDREEEASVLTANIIDKIAKVKIKEPVFITDVQLEPNEAAITVEDGPSNVKVQLNCIKNPVRKLPQIPRHTENVASTTPLIPPIPQCLSSPRPQVAHSLPTFINQFSNTEWFQRCFNSIDLMGYVVFPCRANRAPTFRFSTDAPPLPGSIPSSVPSPIGYAPALPTYATPGLVGVAVWWRFSFSRLRNFPPTSSYALLAGCLSLRPHLPVLTCQRHKLQVAFLHCCCNCS